MGDEDFDAEKARLIKSLGKSLEKYTEFLEQAQAEADDRISDDSSDSVTMKTRRPDRLLLGAPRSKTTRAMTSTRVLMCGYRHMEGFP